MIQLKPALNVIIRHDWNREIYDRSRTRARIADTNVCRAASNRRIWQTPAEK